MENLVEEFKRGERVWVRDSELQIWEERIYLTTIDDYEFPFFCVDPNYEEEFENKEKFEYLSYKQIKKLKKIETKKVTLEEVAKKFGVNKIEIIKKYNNGNI